MLPGMDGLACLKQLQLQAASQPALRVVIVTALNDADKKHEALANGAEAYVCLLYTSPSPRDATLTRMPSSA